MTPAGFPPPPATGRYSLATNREDVALGLASGLGIAWWVFQIMLVLATVVGQMLTEGPSFVITGNSMNPSIDRGAVVLTDTPSPDALKPGDIVSFRLDDRTITHRIIERDESHLITKGDANDTLDSTPIPVEAVKGKAKLVVPFVGLPRLWFQDQRWAPLGLWITTSLFAAASIGAPSRADRRRRARFVQTHTRSPFPPPRPKVWS